MFFFWNQRWELGRWKLTELSCLQVTWVIEWMLLLMAVSSANSILATAFSHSSSFVGRRDDILRDTERWKWCVESCQYCTPQKADLRDHQVFAIFQARVSRCFTEWTTCRDKVVTAQNANLIHLPAALRLAIRRHGWFWKTTILTQLNKGKLRIYLKQQKTEGGIPKYSTSFGNKWWRLLGDIALLVETWNIIRRRADHFWNAQIEHRSRPKLRQLSKHAVTPIPSTCSPQVGLWVLMFFFEPLKIYLCTKGIRKT